MQRKCLKCGHINSASTGDALEACPQCGAIYSRVEAALAARAAAGPNSVPARPIPPIQPATQPPAQPAARGTQARTEKELDVADFAEKMRSASLYPTFRSLVKLISLFWMALAVGAAIVAVVVLFKGNGIGRITGVLGGVFSCLFCILVARLTSEMSLMLADLSDAAVRIAAKQEA